MLIPLPVAFSFVRVERFGLTRFSNILRSRYTGKRQMITYPFAVWEFEGSLVEYDSDQARLIRSFLVKLKGQENSFKLPVPGYSKPSTGFALANVTAAAAAVRATSLTLSSVGSANVPLFKEGDYFTINDELKMVAADATFGAGATVVVTFEPPLRAAVTNATAVTVQNPYVLLNSTDDDAATWGLSAPVRQKTSIECVEAFSQ